MVTICGLRLTLLSLSITGSDLSGVFVVAAYRPMVVRQSCDLQTARVASSRVKLASAVLTGER